MAGRRSIKDPKTGEMKIVPLKGKPREDKIFRRLEASVPKDELREVMESIPDERAQHLLARMADPAFNRRTLPQLCKEVGLTYATVLHWIQKYHLDQALIQGARRVPKVMIDIATDAESKEVTCGNCKGLKVIPVFQMVEDPETKRKIAIQEVDENGDGKTERCLVCDGAGTLRQVGDADARKLLFDSLKLTGQRGPLVAIQNNNNAPSMEESIASVREVLDVKVEPAP